MTEAVTTPVDVEIAPAFPPGRTQSRTLKVMILASGEFLSTLVNLGSLAVLARVLTIDDYATYRQTILAFFFAVPLLTLGLPQALYYFLPTEHRRPRAVLLENLLMLAGMGLIFSIFLLAGGGKLLAMRFNNPGLERTLILFAPYPLLIMPALGLAACLMARGQVRAVAVYHLFSRLVTGSLIIGAVLLWRSAPGAIIANVAAAGVVLVPALWLMLRATRGGQTSLPTPSGMWEQTKFAVPLGLTNVLATLSMSLDKVVVASMCSPEDFAIYANGAMEIPLIGVVTGSIMAVLLPDIRRLRVEGKNHEALDLWKRGAAKSALIILPIMCFLFFMAPDVMTVLYSPKYAASALPFRLYLLLLPFRVITFGVMVMAAGKSKLLLYRSATALLVNLALSMLLVHLLGYIGAAIAVIVTFCAWSVPYFVVVIGRLYQARPATVLPYKTILAILGVSALGCVGCVPTLLMSGSASVLRLSLAIPLYAAIVVALMMRLSLLKPVAIRAAVNRVLRSRGAGTPGRQIGEREYENRA